VVVSTTWCVCVLMLTVVVVGFCLFPCGEKRSLILGFQSPAEKKAPLWKKITRAREKNATNLVGVATTHT